MAGMIFVVAPHRGAWVETGTRGFAETEECVAPHRGAWVETTTVHVVRINGHGRALTGSRVETEEHQGQALDHRRSSPHGLAG